MTDLAPVDTDATAAATLRAEAVAETALRLRDEGEERDA